MSHYAVESQGPAPGAACREEARARTREQGELFAHRLADQEPAPRVSGQGPRERTRSGLSLAARAALAGGAPQRTDLMDFRELL
jgi:hypothetical protein